MQRDEGTGAACSESLSIVPCLSRFFFLNESVWVDTLALFLAADVVLILYIVCFS